MFISSPVADIFIGVNLFLIKYFVFSTRRVILLWKFMTLITSNVMCDKICQNNILQEEVVNI